MQAKNMTAKKLLEKCEQKIKWINWKFLLDSYRSEFEEIRLTFFKNININGDELKIFIDICENRLDRAKSFLGHTAMSLSIFIGSFVVIVAILIIPNIKSEESFSLIDFMCHAGLTFQLSVYFLLFLALILVLLVGHYRAETHAWYVFKEGALLMKKKKD